MNIITQQDLRGRHGGIVINIIENVNLSAGYETLKPEGPPTGIFQITDASGLQNRQDNETILNSDTVLFELLLQKYRGRSAYFLPLV